MEMEEGKLLVIRENTRGLIKLHRQQHRDEVSDINRAISDLRITPETVATIAKKMRTKTFITPTDLNTLKNGMMEDSGNKFVVLSTDGALRALVRELTGKDANKQIAAAGCLCNLALADGKACTTVAKASGSYLITALDSFTEELVMTCAWTLGNLAGSSPKVCELLITQGAVTKLCDQLGRSEDVQHAVIYALVHFVHQLNDKLEEDYLKKILQHLTKMNLTITSSQLLFILSCHKDYLENVTEDLNQKILDEVMQTMETHWEACQNYSGKGFCCKLVYLLRALANTSNLHDAFLDVLNKGNMGDKIYKMLSEGKKTELQDTLNWLFGNLYQHDKYNAFFDVLLD